jgi:ATP-binding cassette subfamily B protein
MVSQDVFLFTGTVYENIVYGNLDATYEQVEEAAKAAGIYDDIMALPDGFDTYVGERGVKFSGGQKQRISIARVFLKDPPILILDEATSALDNATEAYIKGALDRLCENRTTLVVAHRLTTVEKADEIVVTTAKGIEEKGTHQQLLEKNGAYASLHRSQG